MKTHSLKLGEGKPVFGWLGDFSVLGHPVVKIYKDDARTFRRSYFGEVQIRTYAMGFPMIHSFQVTSEYVIIVVCSLHINAAIFYAIAFAVNIKYGLDGFLIFFAQVALSTSPHSALYATCIHIPIITCMS